LAFKVHAASPAKLQRAQLDLIQNMNRHLAATSGAPDAGMIRSYELSFRMEGKIAGLLDTSKERQNVLDAYGLKPARKAPSRDNA
jgi:hypothetical protein